MKKLFSLNYLSWYFVSLCYIVLTYFGASKMALTEDNIEFFKSTNLLDISTLVGLIQFIIALGFLFKFIDKYVIVFSSIFLVSEIILRILFMNSQGILIPSFMLLFTWFAYTFRKNISK